MLKVHVDSPIISGMFLEIFNATISKSQSLIFRRVVNTLITKQKHIFACLGWTLVESGRVLISALESFFIENFQPCVLNGLLCYCHDPQKKLQLLQTFEMKMTRLWYVHPHCSRKFLRLHTLEKTRITQDTLILLESLCAVLKYIYLYWGKTIDV